jgi:hypothetical protein
LGNVKPREKTLLWVDLKTKNTEDKNEEGKENVPFKK